MADKYISKFTPLGSSTTYLLKDKEAIENITRSGTTFTATRRDGTTFTFTQQDNNTIYTFASGTNGSFSVTPSGGSAQTISIGKPATAGTADVANSVAWGNITGKPSSFTPSSHTHYELATQGDNRTVATTPNDYVNRLIFRGLKTNSSFGSPSSDTYSYVIGLRGWSDSSGGHSHELAFNNTGIYWRSGATTSWGNWYRIYTTGNKPTKSDVGLGNVTNDAQIPKSIGTTKGDIIYWSAANTPARLSIGSAGQVLKVSSNGIPVWSSDNNSLNWGQITQSGANNIEEGASDFTDNTEIFSSYASNNGFADTNATGKVYRRDAIKMYNYIQTKLAITNNNVSVGWNTETTIATIGGTAIKIKIPANPNTNTATAADNILDGSNSGTQITYAPYSAQQSKLSFDTSTTNPTRTDRLNLNGYLYATKVYSGGAEVLTAHQSLANYKTKQTAISDNTGTSESTTATRFIYSISQNENGEISVKTRPLPTYNNYSLPLAANGTRGGIQIGYSESGNNYAVKLSSEKAYVTVPWTDTKVTSVGNHYAPAADTNAALSASASGASAAWSIDVVKAVQLQRDAKGHVTGVTVTSGKIPANPNTDYKVRQTNDTSNTNYRVLLSYAANNDQVDNITHKSGNLIYNPSANKLSTGNMDLTGVLTVTGQTNLNDNLNAQGITATNLLVTGATNFVQSPTAPTPASGDNSTKLATTEFVKTSVAGLSGAMHFKGTTTTEMTDGRTTAAVTISGSSYTPAAGDVVLYSDSEFVWTGSAWERLGRDSSFKTTQSAVDSGTAATNKWVSRIQQNANGVITATMASLDTSGTWSGNAATASKVNNNLVIKLKSGTTEGTNLYTFNGSAGKTLDIKQGTGITLTAAAGSLTITNAGVTGVKGNNESSYRTGNVNLTPANVLGTGTTGQFWCGDNSWSSTLGGSLTITKAGECGVEVDNTQTTNPHKGLFGVGSSGNLGIYDRTYNKWVVYSDPSGNVVLNGNANTATKTGVSTIWLYPENNNEINFGGTNTGTTIYFGYRKKDSRNIPTKFVFGSSTGTADLQVKTVYLGSGTTSYVSSTQYTGNAATATALSPAGTTAQYWRGDNSWQTLISSGTSTLAWNSEVTLATVGGTAIKAKLPANPNTNTDTLVKQTAKSDDKNYKILTTVSDSPTSGNAAEAAYDTDITLNPSTNTITATNFAGSATNAKNTQSNHGQKGFTVDGDANTYYPTLFSGFTQRAASTLLSIHRGYSDTAPDTWNTSTHRGGLTLTVLSNGDTAWGGNHAIGIQKLNTILILDQTYCTMVGDILDTNFGLVVWLRGGGAKYYVTSNGGQSVSVTTWYESHTQSSNTVEPITTVNTDRINSYRWENLWTVKNATNAAAADKVNKALKIQGNGTDSFSFDGSAAKTLNIKAGNNVTVSSDTSGNITIASSYINTDTKVTQGTTTTANWRKVLLNGGSDNIYAAWDTAVVEKTDVIYQSKEIAVQPSTGSLAANTIYVKGTYPNIIGNGTGVYFSIDGSWAGSKGNVCIEANTMRPSSASSTAGMNLGSSGNRWSKLYVGSADSYGGAEQPIYWDNGVPKATTYALKATVNNATQWGVAYYSTARNITSTAQGAANTALMGKGAAAPAFVSVSPSSAWTAGTTAGPSLKITVLGVTQSTGAAIPVANGTTASGVVTTTTQTFGGNKTFSGVTTFSNTTDSTHSKDTAAAVVVKGGVSVEKRLSAKEVRIDNNQSSKGVSLQYDATLEVLNFVFS